MAVRAASHAGSWYTDSGSKLSAQLDGWLGQVQKEISKPIRGVIAPHAGYSYSGPPAAFAYRYIDHSVVERVFILGPSHHVYLPGCALSRCAEYDTPLGRLQIDQKMVRELEATGQFEFMSQNVDEDEHSIEMHLPYVYKVMEPKKGNFTVVPILVGGLTTEKEIHYGKLLSKYLADPANLFVISSDFCHWGKRFSYTYYDKSHAAIHQSIEALDRRGMQIIEEVDPPKFAAYLKETKNTICGRHPIGVFLNAVDHLHKQSPSRFKIQFTRYAQSSKVVQPNDSSVSYASAVCFLEN